MMKKKRTLRIAIVLVALVLAGAIAFAMRSGIHNVSWGSPTAFVKRGDLPILEFANGELNAKHIVTLVAPPIGGGALQITRLLHTGTAVKPGEMVLEFDPSEQQYKLEQSRSDLAQAEEEIKKANADAAVQIERDKTALLKDNFDVRSAELDVSKNELLSAIDAKKNELALSEAKRALEQLQTDIKSHGALNQAGIAAANEKHHKAELAMKQAQENIQNMKVASSIAGRVVLERNETGIIFDQSSMPEFKEGDQVQPGAMVARVLDPVGMELTAKVGEVERSSLQVGQTAEIHLDSLPGVTYHGKITTAGGATSSMFFETSKTFDITLEITDGDTRLRPGSSAQIIFLGSTQKNVLYLPSPTIFKKDDKSVVYVRSGSGFEAKPVKVVAQTEGRVAIEGVQEGTEVSLVDPTTLASRGSHSSAGNAIGGGTP